MFHGRLVVDFIGCYKRHEFNISLSLLCSIKCLISILIQYNMYSCKSMCHWANILPLNLLDERYVSYVGYGRNTDHPNFFSIILFCGNTITLFSITRIRYVISPVSMWYNIEMMTRKMNGLVFNEVYRMINLGTSIAIRFSLGSRQSCSGMTLPVNVFMIRWYIYRYRVNTGSYNHILSYMIIFVRLIIHIKYTRRTNIYYEPCSIDINR